MTTIIGLTGYAQHGKDTVGKVLIEEFGFTRFAFADPLKSMTYTLNPIVFVEETDEEATRCEAFPNGIASGFYHYADLIDDYGIELAKKVAEVRRLLQVMGTECVRDHLGVNAWVDATGLAIQEAGVERAVITDARFPNEFEWTKANGELWRVSRLNADGTPFDNGLGTSHPSEQFIATAPYDLMLQTADIEELREMARLAMKAVAI